MKGGQSQSTSISNSVFGSVRNRADRIASPARSIAWISHRFVDVMVDAIR
jgi:hypothetical protein